MRNQIQSPTPYTLDKTAQEHLKQGINTLWQSYVIIEFIQKTLTNEEQTELHAALNGVLALMSSGLDDLGEV